MPLRKVTTCILLAGRFEFTAFLPRNTQGLIIRPLGRQGVMIAATDTQRGFGKLDQVGTVLILALHPIL